jgi:chemotaxis protein methyltransferase CheR
MARPTPAAVPDDPAFAQLKGRLIARTGHHYYQDKDSLLWDRVLRRMREAGVRDVAGYAALLDDSWSGEAEWAALEAEVTIGETYFFRYAEQFTALARTILPEIVRRNRDSRRIRIWSAGCATGAEPYSIAILLARLLGAEVDDWRIGIIGTDINEKFLATARSGIFGRWALRAVDDREREELFVAEGRDRWRLVGRYRRMVRFERHNLLSLIDGTSPLQFSEFDLILCRNVLIYFDPAIVPGLVAQLYDRLKEEGWLLIGHAEPNPDFSRFMHSVPLPGTAAYRRAVDQPQDGTAEPPPAPREEAPAPEPPPAWLPAADPPSALPHDRPLPAAPAPPAPAPLSPLEVPRPAPLPDIRALCDRGDLDAAMEACALGLSADPTDPVLHYYCGLVHRERGLAREAETWFRKALYLDRSFIMAHYQYGLTLIDIGRADAGRRSLSTAAQLCRALPGGTLLPEGDGIDAASLIDMVRLRFEPRFPHAGRKTGPRK